MRCDAQAAEADKQWVAASQLWNTLGQTAKALEAIKKTNDSFLIKPVEAASLASEGKCDRAAALYEQVEDWDKAIQNWEKAKRWQEAANVYLKAERYAEAEEYALKLSTPIDRARFRVRIQIAQNNLDGARQVAKSEMSLDEAIKFFQTEGLYTQARYFSAHLAEEKGRMALAIRLWKQIGDTAQIARINISLSQQNSIGLDKTLSNNNVADTGPKPDEIGETTQDQAPSTKVSVVKIYNRGLSLQKAGRLWEAIAVFRDAIAHGLDNHAVHFNLGSCLKDVGELTEAIRELQKAAMLSESHHDTHFVLGNAYHDKGHHSDAVTEYSRAAMANVRSSDALTNIGNILAEQEKFHVATEFYLHALAVNPRDMKAFINLACTYSDMGDDENALKTLQQAVLVDPHHANAHANLGKQYKKMGGSVRLANYHAACHYEEAIRLNPNHANAHYGLGIILLGWEEWKSAADEFSIAYRINPQDVEASYNLGVALCLDGQVSEGLAQARKTVEAYPNFETSLRALEQEFSAHAGINSDMI